MEVSEEFKVTQLNSDFSLCSTYPRHLIVPWCMSDEELQQVAAFRSRGRLPAVVWRHPGNGAHISRCAQPCVGTHSV